MKIRSALLLTLAAAAAAPAFADPPPWAPAHGHRAKVVREYRYVYYPAAQVYYQPEQRVWFWMNGGSWQFGVNLPAQYQGYVSSGVPVMLNTSRPYTQHVYVEEHYGRPWRTEHHFDRDHGPRYERHDHDHDDHRRDWDHRGHRG
jgi:hypothetical protein